MLKIPKKIRSKYLTDSGVSAVFSETREMGYLLTRDIESVSAVQYAGNFGSGTASRDMAPRCRHCYLAQGQMGQGDDQMSAPDNVGTGTEN